MTSLIPIVGGWVLLALIVIGLALYRKFVSAYQEDRYLHLAEAETKLIPHQIAMNQRIVVIDRLGELLTMFTLIAGVVLACIYVFAKL